MSNDNETLAVAFLRQMEQNNLDGALELASDDLQYWLAGPGYMNKEQMTGFFAPVAAMVERMRFTVTGTTSQDNRVALEAEGEASLKNGRIYRNRYHFLFEINAGKISAVREYADSAPAVAAFFAP